MGGQRRVARGGAQPGGLERILEADRDPVQWPVHAAVAQLAVGAQRCGPRRVAIDRDQRVEGGVESIDALEMLLERFTGRQLSRAYTLRQGAGVVAAGAGSSPGCLNRR